MEETNDENVNRTKVNKNPIKWNVPVNSLLVAWVYTHIHSRIQFKIFCSQENVSAYWHVVEIPSDFHCSALAFSQIFGISSHSYYMNHSTERTGKRSLCWPSKWLAKCTATIFGQHKKRQTKHTASCPGVGRLHLSPVGAWTGCGCAIFKQRPLGLYSPHIMGRMNCSPLLPDLGQ